MTAVPVLDVGGSHVTATLVDATSWRPVDGTRRRLPLRSDGPANDIIATIAACASTLGSLRGSTLSVAMPGPFDYEAGVGRFVDVAKFDSLNGVDVRAALLAALPDPPTTIVFLNDAVAFGLGEWIAGAARGRARAVALTLGTGVGSAFIDRGAVISSGPRVPPGGYAHLLSIDEQPLEDVVSARAIVAAYERHPLTTDPDFDGSDSDIDVQEIAARAFAGDRAAHHALTNACRALGVALAPWLAAFEAETLVVGGGIAASWQLIEPALRAGIDDASSQPTSLELARSTDTAASVEAGAAWHACGSSTR